MKNIKKLMLFFFTLSCLASCDERIKEGYCVGKKYLPEHYVDTPHSQINGKVITTYYTRDRIESKFYVGFANMDKLEVINVDSLSFYQYEPGKYYLLKNNIEK